MIGVASLPLVMLPLIEAQVPIGGSVQRLSPAAIVALNLLQPAILLAVGVALGATLAHRIGLCSHIAAVNVTRSFAREWPLAAASGALVALAIVGFDVWLFVPRMPELAALQNSTGAGGIGIRIAGVLYGGMTEELMTRWGLMTLVAWGAWRLSPRHPQPPTTWVFVVAIVAVALLFAAGHLPVTLKIVHATAWVITRALVLNGMAGALYGWLCWRRSLESAILAHAMGHVVFALVGFAHTA